MLKHKSMAKKETDAERIQRTIEEKRRNEFFEQMKRDGKPIKFVREYKDENGKVVSKWHYDLKKTMNGPVLVEEIS